MKRISLLLFLVVLTCNSSAQTVVLVDPAVVELPAVGEDLNVSIKISQGNNIAGYQFTLEFDDTALEYITIVNSDFLPAGALAIPRRVSDGGVMFVATNFRGSSGDGTLAKATFKVLRKSNSALRLSGVKLSQPGGLVAIVSRTVDGAVRFTALPLDAKDDRKLNTTTISFSSVSDVKVGDKFTIDVLVEDVIDLAGWQMDLLFDSEILEFTQVEEGSFLKQGGGQTFWQPGKSDMGGAIKRGTVSDISAAFLGQGGVSGTGKLLTVTFKAKLAGVSVLDLGNLHLGDPSGEVIQHRIATGIVTVVDFPAWDVNRDGIIYLT